MEVAIMIVIVGAGYIAWMQWAKNHQKDPQKH